MNLQNKALVPVGNFLQSLTLPAQVSRARTKLVASLNAELQNLAESEKQLVADFNGEVNDQGQINWPKNKDGKSKAPVEYHTEHAVLLNEEVTIELNQPTLMKALKDYFAEWNEDIDPQYAEAFDAFFDALETEQEN
ncbi:hypothetical protein [Weissella paramesenteroides]|uniref:hypothetical protein n=1 Tax=Weissella paramesenteroides TaxID=1249 RepID=UPI002E7BDCB8|nr:hypothetical protein [Weissella paramesenteroides]WPQ68438.1 hypothetical protein QRX23_02235 [Weissella paramesenteroides]